MFKNILFTSLVLAITGVVGLPGESTSSPLAPSRAEASACSVAMDASVRDQVYGAGSAFAVRPIRERVFLARALQPVRTMGATVHVHAMPGMTQQYLERALQCHARGGQAVNPSDPLVIQDGAIRDVDVRSAGGAFAVRIIGDSPAAGRAIMERAESLVGGSVSVQQL
ncbi:MAG: hypothetical protein R3B40_20665 [Polyangiales bacterium]|nr:hypothetical protein [Myxococcales bacterium]MCB9662265.1 hypothetical protein [Sandaracinaceae bacterium]